MKKVRCASDNQKEDMYPVDIAKIWRVATEKHVSVGKTKELKSSRISLQGTAIQAIT